MTKEELAQKLNGSLYPFYMHKETRAEAIANGLVVVTGASDDLMEIEGAINDEISVYGGGEVIIYYGGTLEDWESFIEKSPSERQAREYFDKKDRSATIEAIWCEEGCSWIYKTDIPHAVFDVMKDGEIYCRGIVFSIHDIGAKQ